jgi:oligo-1,6-glucosidase
VRGILAHVDHLVRLGVDVVWLSPVYRSPMDDNGYDISDYRDVDPLFGTLDDLDELTAALHARGIRLVMDLVVNHTSDEHPWFVESRS